MKVTSTIDDSLVVDFIENAFLWIGYWAEVTHWEPKNLYLKGKADGEEFVITPYDLEQAFASDADITARLIDGQYDVEDGDIILQLAAFGEIVYG